MKFSIIIPTYNRATLLPETIKSVQNQTYTNWECIVVDDGSSDNTKEIVESIIQNDNRIKYLYQKNAERSAARNNGIRNSTGNFICFLDSDDHFMPDHLINLQSFIQKQKNTVCLIINQSINVSNFSEEITNLEQPGDNSIEFLYLNPVSPSRVCINHEILKQITFDEDIVIVEDVILWMKIADKYPIYVSNHIGVIYNIHEGNSVNRKGAGALVKYNGVILAKKRYPNVFNKISKKNYNAWTSRILTNVAYYHILNDNKKEGLKWLLKALVMKPFHMHTKLRINLILKLILNKKPEVLLFFGISIFSDFYFK